MYAGSNQITLPKPSQQNERDMTEDTNSEIEIEFTGGAHDGERMVIPRFMPTIKVAVEPSLREIMNTSLDDLLPLTVLEYEYDGPSGSLNAEGVGRGPYRYRLRQQ